MHSAFEAGGGVAAGEDDDLSPLTGEVAGEAGAEEAASPGDDDFGRSCV